MSLLRTFLPFMLSASALAAELPPPTTTFVFKQIGDLLAGRTTPSP